MRLRLTAPVIRRAPVWVWAVAALAVLAAGAAAARGALPVLLLILAAGAGIPLAVLFLRRPAFGVVLVVLSILPGQLVRLSLGTDDRGGAAMLLSDILLPLVIVVWLGRKATGDQRFPRSALGTPIFAFLAVALISLMLGAGTVVSLVSAPGKPLIVAALYLVRFGLYALFFFAVHDLLRTAAMGERLLAILLWVAALLAIGGFFQLWLYPDMTQLAIAAGWDPHQGRLVASFLDPNFIGTFFAMNLLVVTALLLERTILTRKRIVWLLAAGVILGVGLLLTYSRGALLGFLAGFALIGIIRSPRMLVTGLLAMTLAVTALPRLTQRITEGLSVDETGVKRIESWTKATKLFAAMPVLGTGYNTLSSVQDALGLVDEFDVNNRGGVENSLLSIAVTTGIVGLIAFIILYAAMFAVSLRAWYDRRSSSRLRVLGLGVAAALLAAFVASMTLNALLYPFILIEMWALLAIVERREQLEWDAASA